MLKKPCEPQVGADIECFLLNKETMNVVPCVGILPGTKAKPYPLPGLKKGFAVQEDNVMVEFNIPPATSYAQFVDSIYKARRGINRMLAERYTQPYGLLFMDSCKFTEDQLTSKQAQTIGCEPDFDAYVGGEVRTNFPNLGLNRGAGGHVHLGGNFQCPDFVAALFADAMIGLGARTVGVRKSPRQMWYGMPGIFRPKPYGIEYRSPGSSWADGKSQQANVASMALRLAKWLTDSDAKEIQSVFRRINWADVRNALTPEDGTSPEAEEFRVNVTSNCAKAGLPI